MKTRGAFGRALDPSKQSVRAPFGLGTPSGLRPGCAAGAVGAAHHPGSAEPPALALPHPACDTLPGRPCRHPLADLAQNEVLAQVEDMVKGRFDSIIPVLRAIAAIQHAPDFAVRAQALALPRFGDRQPSDQGGADQRIARDVLAGSGGHVALRHAGRA